MTMVRAKLVVDGGDRSKAWLASRIAPGAAEVTRAFLPAITGPGSSGLRRGHSHRGVTALRGARGRGSRGYRWRAS